MRPSAQFVIKTMGIYNCWTYLETSVEWILSANCLSSHNGKQCTSNEKCLESSSPYSTLSYAPFLKPKPSRVFILTKQQGKYSILTLAVHMCDEAITKKVFFSTAIVKVKSPDGTFYTVRDLIDENCIKSFYTRK